MLNVYPSATADGTDLFRARFCTSTHHASLLPVVSLARYTASSIPPAPYLTIRLRSLKGEPRLVRWPSYGHLNRGLVNEQKV